MFMCNFNSGDPTRPSFFEMMAQQQMMPTFKPALKYVFSVLSQRHPVFNWFVKRSDEIFNGTLLVIEQHYLNHYDASFAENFYGMKRMRAQDPNTIATAEMLEKSQKMQRYDKLLSLLLLVVVPYLKHKLDKLYKRYSNPLNSLGFIAVSEGPPDIDFSQDRNTSETNANTTNTQRFLALKKLLPVFKTIFLKVWPWLNALYEGSFFAYQLLYLYDGTQYYTPFYHLQKITMRRLTVSDIEEQRMARETRRLQRIMSIRNLPAAGALRLLMQGVNLFLDYSRYIFPAMIFFFKFIEWWYSENRITQPPLPIPPPPIPPQTKIMLPTDKTLCPLCSRTRNNPAMSSSGYVFCYPCIFNYVSLYQRCPVTFIPTTQQQIRKIYEAR
eukprot:TRINITY_DN2625_c0_g3_i1.p1 TRINITY_DN2625_c0_g3~~TRINITY_DN2625_c0_g3_i1.p1  ORF type:complete len:417 (-),score=92.57 TRINITY_DN2625_c0_g3_i1:115-1266(-)